MDNYFEISSELESKRNKFRLFVNDFIAPSANQTDKDERIPSNVIDKIINQGFWGTEISEQYGGKNFDKITYGLFSEEIGRGCSNVRNLLGVQGMVSIAIAKWGTNKQKEKWLRKMASGELIAAFALTEPEIGSDAAKINTSAEKTASGYCINGKKKWISFAQNADIFLLFAQVNGQAGAFVIERNTPGFNVNPIKDLLGFKGSGLGEIELNNCIIPEENLIGRIGFGVSNVAYYGLMHGRYSTAWGCVGLAQNCLEESIKYSRKRKQFDKTLLKHQLIQQMIADMITETNAARCLCLKAGYLYNKDDINSTIDISVAKYYASITASKAASNAVQILGANGCSSDYGVQRNFRDAKIMEIVEGSTQIQQQLIARYYSFKK